MVKKRPLGATGLMVTEVGFGAWGIGSKHYGSVEETEAADAVRGYLDAGGNFIDTARGYNTSEEIIGKILKERGNRDSVVLASKVWPTDPKAMWDDLHTSLKMLGVDVIDLYYQHMPPDDVDEMNRCLDTMDEMKAQGKIRFVGQSIKSGNVTQATIDLCRQYIGTGRVNAFQLIFSILRQKNREIFQEAQAAGIGIVARTNLESGFLTGKYHKGYQFPPGFPDGDHRSRWNGDQLDQILEVVDELKSFAVEAPYESLAQVSLRFALEEPGVSSIIPGAKNPKQARANVAVADMPPLESSIRERMVREYAGKEDLVNLLT